MFTVIDKLAYLLVSDTEALLYWRLLECHVRWYIILKGQQWADDLVFSICDDLGVRWERLSGDTVVARFHYSELALQMIE